MIKPKSKVGRPSKFSSIKINQLKFLIEKGCTDNEIAEFFNINRETFWRWQRENPDFSNTIKDWKKYANERVERSLYERAVGYSHESEEIFCAFGKVTRVKTIKHYPPSEIAAFFWLKNRRPDIWRDKREDLEDADLKDAELSFGFVKKVNGHRERFEKFYG